MSVPMFVNLQERLKEEKEDSELKEEQLRAVCQEYYSLKKRYGELEEKAELLRSENQELHSILTEKEEQFESRGNEAELCRGKVEEMEANAEELSTQLEESKQINKELENDIAAKNGEIDNLNRVMSKLKQVCKKRKEEQLAEKQTVFNLKNELVEANKRKDRTNNLFIMERNKNDRLRMLMDGSEVKRRSADDIKGKLEKEVEMLTKKVRLVELHLKLERGGKRELETRVEESEIRVRELTTELRNLKQELGEVLKVSREREQKVMELTLECDYLRHLPRSTEKEVVQEDSEWDEDEIQEEEQEEEGDDGENSTQGDEKSDFDDIDKEQRRDDALSVAEVTCGAFLQLLDEFYDPAEKRELDAEEEDQENTTPEEVSIPERMRTLREENVQLMKELQIGRQLYDATIDTHKPK